MNTREARMVEKLREALQTIADKAQQAYDRPVTSTHILREIWSIAEAALILDILHEDKDEK